MGQYVAPFPPSNSIPSSPTSGGAIGVSQSFARADHQHPPQVVGMTVTPSTPSRSLNSVFQPSTTTHTLGLYSVQISCTASLTGGQAGQVQLLSDASNPPTTVRVTTANQNTSGLTIGLTVVNNQTTVLPYLIPVNHYVKLVTTNTTGTPTYTLVSQTEEALT